MPFDKTLQIAVVGAGRIGSTLAFNLARNGHHDVSVIARAGSKRLKELQQASGIINDKGEKADVHIEENLYANIAYDLLIITVLRHQIEPLLPVLTDSRAKKILFMFNNFEPEKLRDIVGEERGYFGMPFFQADFDKDGRLIAKIGAGGQKSLLGNLQLVDLFTSSNLPAAYEPDMPLWLRCHAPVCVAMESASVMAVRRAGGASWEQCMTLARGLHESFILIQKLGYQLYPSPKAQLKKSPVWVAAGILWTVSRIKSFRELLATGESECRALVDAMVAGASQAKPPITVTAIKAMKPDEQLQASFKI